MPNLDIDLHNLQIIATSTDKDIEEFEEERERSIRESRDTIEALNKEREEGRVRIDKLTKEIEEIREAARAKAAKIKQCEKDIELVNDLTVALKFYNEASAVVSGLLDLWANNKLSDREFEFLASLADNTFPLSSKQSKWFLSIYDRLKSDAIAAVRPIELKYNHKESYARVYMVSVENAENKCIKIGFTAQSLRSRIESFPEDADILLMQAVKGDVHLMAAFEEYLHAALKEYRHKWRGVKFSGCSECYDINLDIDIKDMYIDWVRRSA